MPNAFAWDDLRYALAVARTGALPAAARDLGINHSTIFRRLNALETKLGTRIFERLPSGFRPTEAGERLLACAERMESEAIGLDRDLTGRDARLTGKLKITSSETLAFRALTDEIARFRETHPGIPYRADDRQSRARSFAPGSRRGASRRPAV